MHLWAAKRIMKLYGAYDGAVQFPAYRCSSCARVIVWTQIRSGRGCMCGSGNMRASNFTLWEELRILFMPWSFPTKGEVTAVSVKKYIPGGDTNE